MLVEVVFVDGKGYGLVVCFCLDNIWIECVGMWFEVLIGFLEGDDVVF